MQPQTQLDHDRILAEKIQKVKELYADAPESQPDGRKGLAT